jgi:hypothetical protein
MHSIARALVAAAVFLAAGAAAAHGSSVLVVDEPGTNTHFKDSRSIGDGLDQTGRMRAKLEDFEISWNISYDPGTLIWTYAYTFTGADEGVSHFDLQVSDDPDNPFQLSNVLGIEDENGNDVTDEFAKEELHPRTHTIGKSGEGGGSHSASHGHGLFGPFLDWLKSLKDPDRSFTGIRFVRNDGEDTAFVRLQTTRRAVWGDFQVKKSQAYAYNTGAGDPPPVLGFLPNTRDTYLDWIPTPDTLDDPPVAIPSPAAAAAGLVLLGALGLLRRRGRSR